MFLINSCVNSIKFQKFFRFDTFRNIDDWVSLRRSWLPNINLLDEIAMINNFDPFVPARFAKWLQATAELRRVGDDFNYRRVLRMSGVQVLVVVDEKEGLKTTSLEGSQRFQFFQCARTVTSSDEALQAVMTDPELGVTQIVVETTERNGDEHCQTDAYAAPSITVLSESANRIQVELITNHQGWLVMKDTFYPGWVAKVNGVRQSIYAANSIFRAVRVAEGRSLIEFYYQPLSFSSGVALSILSLIPLLLFPG
ncbi:MAG: hypothetical protein D6735_12420, partial [Acidobacteria bacterium]